MHLHRIKFASIRVFGVGINLSYLEKDFSEKNIIASFHKARALSVVLEYFHFG